MAKTDIAGFRRLCGQFRWLAIFMVFSVGAILVLTYVIAPVVMGLRGNLPNYGPRTLAGLIMGAPSFCYLFGVWSISRALGQLHQGRLIQPILAGALRRVGLALGLGGVLQVFVITQLLQLIGQANGGYLIWDVGAMTLGMIGGALFLLGRVVDEAGKVQAELDDMI